MQFVADLHLHSPYSRADSPQMTLQTMASRAVEKGLQILSAADWTHPKWIKEIQEQLREADEGIFQLREGGEKEKEIGFILGSEISSIYKQKDKLRRIHTLFFVPSFATAEKITKELIQRGCNLQADGRPIVGLSARDLLEMVLEIDDKAIVIPAHAWTPHFGVYGSASGFDSLEEAFGDLRSYIYGIETGLSSDPEMNWQIPELETRSILSFSDAHSPAKMGRESTLFELEKRTFTHLFQAINRASGQQVKNHVISTTEFYPEEGKYHYSGHRLCKVSRSAGEIQEIGMMCPVCHRRLTEGVFSRLQQLAGKDVLQMAEQNVNEKGVCIYQDPRKSHPPFSKMVPLLEIIADTYQMGVGSKKVQKMYTKLLCEVGPEMDILLHVPLDVLRGKVEKNIIDGIGKVRTGNISITPGFDGEYGKVRIWDDQERISLNNDTSQLSFDL